MSERLCWFCRHMTVYEGSCGYSEMTPGSPPTIECDKKRWSVDCYNTRRKPFRVHDRATFREAINMAETCPDFAPEETR